MSEEREKLINKLNTNEWRSPIYCQLILDELKSLQKPTTFLEIGCGIGFDNDVDLQKKMAASADCFLGVEPDASVSPLPIFDKVHKCMLEDAPIGDHSVDVAYSVMVMEHVDDAEAFMRAVARILKPGGIYWGFTVDRRHWFSTAASLAGMLGLKSLYLSWIYRAPRGEGRYLDYPTRYRLNTPDDIQSLSEEFSDIDVWNVGPVDSAARYAPLAFRSLVEKFESWRIHRGRVRTDLVCRLVR